jgi:hypothetical protein
MSTGNTPSPSTVERCQPPAAGQLVRPAARRRTPAYFCPAVRLRRDDGRIRTPPSVVVTCVNTGSYEMTEGHHLAGARRYNRTRAWKSRMGRIAYARWRRRAARSAPTRALARELPERLLPSRRSLGVPSRLRRSRATLRSHSGRHTAALRSLPGRFHPTTWSLPSRSICFL